MSKPNLNDLKAHVTHADDSTFVYIQFAMTNEKKLRVLELFSGIGGMHYALEASGVPGEICAAVDINTTANQVYQYNHRNTVVLNNNIQKFTPKRINELDVNAILMSPPCQPFTRVGNKKDVDDARSNALVHICSILPELTPVDYILMENVKGFETSQARDLYIDALQRSGFYYQEFLLSPTEIGVPNTRYRYYCLARRRKEFSFKVDSILERLPNKMPTKLECPSIESLLPNVNDDSEMFTEYLLSDDILQKRAWLLDITHSNSTNTRCFTKAYTHYAEGTGSIHCPMDKEHLSNVFEEIQNESLSAQEKLDKLKTLKLRYFTPFEVAKLMSFPDTFGFPSEITKKQRYRVLGNSINVAIVGKLITLLYND